MEIYYYHKVINVLLHKTRKMLIMLAEMLGQPALSGPGTWYTQNELLRIVAFHFPLYSRHFIWRYGKSESVIVKTSPLSYFEYIL